MSRGPLAALACVAGALTLSLSACSSDSTAEVAAPTSNSTAQAAAEMGLREQNSAERDTLERIGAAYSAALADSGLPLPPSSNHATLAQVARGICSQLAAGTSEAEIREQLRPFSLFAVSQAGGVLNEDQTGQAYLDAARSHVC